MAIAPRAEQYQKLLTLFKQMQDISLKIQTLLESENPHQDALKILKSETSFDGVQYWSLPPSKTSARLEAFASEYQNVAELGHQLTPSDPILAYVFQTKKNLILETIPHEVKSTSPIVSEGTKSILAMPVLQNFELMGVLIVERKSQGNFDELDVQFLEFITQQLVSLFLNQQLFLDQKAFSKKLQSAVQEKTLELRRAHERILENQKVLQKENKALKSIVELDRRDQDFIGNSPAIKQVLSMVEKVAPTSATVLILGESGTGKELIARQIHFQSDRKNAPFVTLNCAALQESLLESELFGHEKGSFTGALHQKMGLCESADGGTLFLDEIGEMSLSIQTKLLRFLQEGEFYRIGGKRPIQVNVRIISATNRDLAEEVKSSRFREDLYYRLNTITLKLPPLRARKEDIPALCEYYLKHSKFGGVSHVKKIDSRVIDVFLTYEWPGNIRELQNTMERLKILVEDTEIKLDDIPMAMRLPKESANLTHFHVETPLDDIEKAHILRSLAFHQGNKTRTAQSLGITIKTLYNKLHRYGALGGGAEEPSSSLSH
jgi:transcriptional regulator with PAS, ATPase and Fis domain